MVRQFFPLELVHKAGFYLVGLEKLVLAGGILLE
jgi:hypothetical protein